MTIQFQAAYARSPNRVRVAFSSALGSGAFDPGFFSFAVVSGHAVEPAVLDALLVPGRPNELELAVSPPLSDGARYRLDVRPGVPDIFDDTDAGGSDEFATPLPQRAASPDQAESRLLDELFGRDLRHDGADFAEDANGDLADVGGVENGREAVKRRTAADGLMWTTGYGPGLREHIDESVVGLWAVRGKIVSNLRADDRVAAVRVDLANADIDNGTITLPLDIHFVGGMSDQVEARLA